MSQIDEKLLQLSEENAQLKLQLEEKTKEVEGLQIDYANKIATAKVDFETRELQYKRQIKELQYALETRKSNDTAQKRENKKSIADIYKDMLGE